MNALVLHSLSLGERARVREEVWHRNTFSYGTQNLPHPQPLSPREMVAKEGTHHAA